MGKASKSKQDGTSSRRDKIAAQRVEAKRAERRNRLLIAGGAVIVVIAVVVVLIVVKATSKSPSQGSNGPGGSSLSSLVHTVTSVPTSVTDTVGDGNGAVTSKPIQSLPGGASLPPAR